MGGFFQTNDATWTQSTGRVHELAQRKEMKDFIGHLSVKEHNSDSLKEGSLPSEWNKRTKIFIRDLLYII